ncbi:TonB-dependent receptor [bacterium]|nr:TonB-dependent receptor [bacterium]
MRGVQRTVAIGLMLFTVCLASLPVFAGNSGKITGVVYDKATGAPLYYANVVIQGTNKGAACDANGKYTIINVPAGVYTLVATYIGYSTTKVENVRVMTDLTTTIDIYLEPGGLTGQTVTVVAERPIVQKDLTATTAVVGSEEIRNLPVTEIADAVELQAGLVKDAGGGLHVRGGRSGEVSYWIDGVPVTDMYDGGTVVDVNKDMVQELQVVSGAFNAEYGQAMSGIVNITTKRGSNEFGGNITTYFGDHVSSHNTIFMDVGSVNPVSIRNVEGSLYGPLIKDKLYYYVNGRYIYFDGWLNGRRLYNPNAVTGQITATRDFIEYYAPEYLDRAIRQDDGSYAFQYVVGSNAYVDSLVTYFNLPQAKATNPDSLAAYYEKLRNNNKDALGDGKYIPMNWNRKIYTQGKLIYRIMPTMDLSYNYILDDVNYNDYERDYIFNPDGASRKFRSGTTHILKLNHSLSSRTFYNLGISYFIKGFQRYLYEDTHDERYVHPYLELQDPYSFKTGGTQLVHFRRKTRTMLAKFDLTSQITDQHQLKGGIEYRQHNIFQEDINLRPAAGQTDITLPFDSPYIDTRVLADSTIYYSTYRHKPVEFSAYLQDKMEFKSLIVNLGVRMDYFTPDGIILTDESDPNIYNPIKPQNRYHDWGTDGVPGTYDADGSEGNGTQDPGEPNVTLAERQEYWYRDATSKLQISPRIGVSFPITERGIIHFSYGHFFQLPRFELLYQNPDFELGSGTGNVGVIGNADLEPEQTISGELGLQQGLTDDISLSVTAYFRDIRNLTGTKADEILLYGGAARYSKLTNSDFGFIKGVILALNKRFSGGFGASVDYTFQIADGTNSDPEQARNALAGGSLPEVQLVPLNWDQTHTVNASFTYGGRNWGASVIGQWGSGLPYTPRASTDLSTLLVNSQRKPGTVNVDLRAYYDVSLPFGNGTFFVRVFNLFDTLNEINVFNDTGRAGFTTDQLVAERSNPILSVNTLDQWFTNATHYSEPRRIEVGFTYNF